MNDKTRSFENGTHLTTSGMWDLYTSGAALCTDGRVRKLKRIAKTADTFFSVPAAVSVKGKTVTGYVTMNENSVEFSAYINETNEHLLP